MSEEIKMISIPIDTYNQLIEDSHWLECLNEAGVDNWEGMDYAGDLYRDRYQEEK